MTESSSHKKIIPDWEKSAYNSLLNNDYSSVIEIYEQLVKNDPSQELYYCYIGLAYLLDQQEDLAQLTWFTLLSECQSEDLTTKLLTDILDNEAKRQVAVGCRDTSWLIRQYLREISPENIKNILLLIIDSISINQFKLSDIVDSDILRLLSHRKNTPSLNFKLIEAVGDKLASFNDPLILDFLSLLSDQIDDLDLRWLFLMTNASKADKEDSNFAACIAELCTEFYPNDPRTWVAISYFNSRAKNYARCIEAAKCGYLNSSSVEWKAVSSYTLVRELMLSGGWTELEESINQYKFCLTNLIQEGLESGDKNAVNALVTTPCLLQYYQDKPKENRFFQNKISEIYQSKIDDSYIKNSEFSKSTDINFLINSDQKIRVGFIAHTLTSHSVGWLFRWFCKYVNSSKFDITLFLISQDSKDFFANKWFVANNLSTFFLKEEYLEIVKLIKSKDIQVLIDLDSLTLQETCKVLAYKPAPVQITWLGFDATGLPAVDYFLADPYVLPNDAQEYYQEKIYRLPHTYIAVDGFEVGTPTLRKEDLSIPPDSIVFLTAQTGLKRNPDFVRQQLKIIKQVPNSYLLIKGSGDSQKIQALFYALAEEIDVPQGQLRFLSFDKSEFYHRANMQIADVVLDTYPYNGATTTLEALWMGIPVVTRVGEQFSSRNGYAFLTHVGVTEGIATTDDEYVQWGVRFGMDEQLRQRVCWQLYLSRQNSPLWNARQFTQELEYAFEDIWRKYLQSIN
jgi:predicted O-linked N-acetylglucosamine transferase (SPINDLY family)